MHEKKNEIFGKPRQKFSGIYLCKQKTIHHRDPQMTFSLKFALPSCFMNWKSFRACILWERQWKRIWTQGNILTCHFSTLGVHSVNSFREISYSFFFHRLLVRAKKLFPLLHNLQSDVWKSESSLDLSVLDICVRMLIFGTETGYKAAKYIPYNILSQS